MKHYLLTYIDDRGRFRLAGINATSERQARIDASRLVRSMHGRFVRLSAVAV